MASSWPGSIGWDLILEYLFSGAAVAVSWSGAIQEFLAEPWFGIKLPAVIGSAPFAIDRAQTITRTSWASPTNTTRWLPRAPWSTCPRFHFVGATSSWYRLKESRTHNLDGFVKGASSSCSSLRPVVDARPTATSWRPLKTAGRLTRVPVATSGWYS